LNWQLPGKASSLDGSNTSVKISDGLLGWRAVAMYYTSVDERVRLGCGVQMANIPFSFIWSGDQTALGGFGSLDGSSVGLPVENWEVTGPVGELQLLLYQKQKLFLLGILEADIGFGSGTSTFVWREQQPDSVELETFRVETRFNRGRVPIPTIRTFLRGELQSKNLNRWVFGVGISVVLNGHIVSGTYSAITSDRGKVEGTFRSTTSTVECQLGYVFSWGYPKVPREWKQ